MRGGGRKENLELWHLTNEQKQSTAEAQWPGTQRSRAGGGGWGAWRRLSGQEGPPQSPDTGPRWAGAFRGEPVSSLSGADVTLRKPESADSSRSQD